MKAPWSLLRAVALREWPAVLAAVVVALGVEVGLRTLTLPRLTRLAGLKLGAEEGSAAIPMGAAPPRLAPRAWRQLRATQRVMRHWPFGDTCLRQALVSGQRLRRLQPTLLVGVARVDGTLRAHAWLEIQGVSLDPAGAAVYEPLEPIREDGHA